MLSYTNLVQYFGTSLFDRKFQIFLSTAFTDLTKYNILKSDYITSEITGVDLGFTNNNAVYDEDDEILFEKGAPVFSHFVLYPKSTRFIDNFPFDMSFNDNRNVIHKKAGNPTQTKEGYSDLLNKRFLVDNYKVDNIIITFDYIPEKGTINFIQVRDNDLLKHLKL